MSKTNQRRKTTWNEARKAGRNYAQRFPKETFKEFKVWLKSFAPNHRMYCGAIDGWNQAHGQIRGAKAARLGFGGFVR